MDNLNTYCLQSKRRKTGRNKRRVEKQKENRKVQTDRQMDYLKTYRMCILKKRFTTNAEKGRQGEIKEELKNKKKIDKYRYVHLKENIHDKS